MIFLPKQMICSFQKNIIILIIFVQRYKNKILLLNSVDIITHKNKVYTKLAQNHMKTGNFLLFFDIPRLFHEPRIFPRKRCPL